MSEYQDSAALDDLTFARALARRLNMVARGAPGHVALRRLADLANTEADIILQGLCGASPMQPAVVRITVDHNQQGYVHPNHAVGTIRFYVHPRWAAQQRHGPAQVLPFPDVHKTTTTPSHDPNEPVVESSLMQQAKLLDKRFGVFNHNGRKAAMAYLKDESAEQGQVVLADEQGVPLYEIAREHYDEIMGYPLSKTPLDKGTSSTEGENNG